MKRELGAYWKWLPEGAVYHDPNAYLASLPTAPEPDPLPVSPAVV